MGVKPGFVSLGGFFANSLHEDRIFSLSCHGSRRPGPPPPTCYTTGTPAPTPLPAHRHSLLQKPAGQGLIEQHMVTYYKQMFTDMKLSRRSNLLVIRPIFLLAQPTILASTVKHLTESVHSEIITSE